MYCFYIIFFNGGIAGSSFPSRHSRNAPPAVDMYEKSDSTPALFNVETVSPPPATEIS